MEKDIESPILDETQPHQIHAPSFKGTGMRMQPPFVNQHGGVIGDSKYNSPNSRSINGAMKQIRVSWRVMNGCIRRTTSAGTPLKTVPN